MSTAILLTQSDQSAGQRPLVNTEVQDSTSTPSRTGKANLSGWQIYLHRFSVVYNGVMANK